MVIVVCEKSRGKKNLLTRNKNTSSLEFLSTIYLKYQVSSWFLCMNRCALWQTDIFWYKQSVEYMYPKHTAAKWCYQIINWIWEEKYIHKMNTRWMEIDARHKWWKLPNPLAIKRQQTILFFFFLKCYAIFALVTGNQILHVQEPEYCKVRSWNALEKFV